MIVHVVIPDTVAASEPRWTVPSKKEPDELAERSKNKAKWPGKSTSTVLDKIRVDFNPTSKSATEKVAQIRLQKSALPPQNQPTTPVPSQYIETSQEQENAWQDLIEKFRILILRSFDLRVSQYEDDIRAREVQRSLPGWNFCTFFTLKEGLARGFESVGLVDDALAVYDELLVGLDLIARDETNLLGDLSSLRDYLEQLLAMQASDHDFQQASKAVQYMYETPLDLGKRDYRGMIVSSSISLFDFQTYIFSRQKELLYRLGHFTPRTAVYASTEEGIKSTESDDDLVYVAQACKRAAAFVTANARVMRMELMKGYAWSLLSPLHLLIAL